ncbi:MAG: class I SAM-dependent methyltransferase [Alphaproteobacteria bacterium]|nr:class I SAM-dependent methyltransferase [Alphaproteobacteria bacterium]
MSDFFRDLRLGLRTAKGFLAQAGSDKRFEHVDSKKYFDSRYNLMPDYDNRRTLSAETTPLYSAMHYNIIEGNILALLNRFHPELMNPKVMDIGSGNGHWIDFYRNGLGARAVTGVDIAAPAVENLSDKYADDKDISIFELDFSSNDVGAVGRDYDIINSIGTIHHITDEEKWQACVHNIASCLAPGGVCIVSDRFGFMSINDMFTSSDSMTGWSRQKIRRGAPGDGCNFLLMRGRSRKAWTEAAKAAGCRVLAVRPYRAFMLFPGLSSRFNIMMFQKVR